MSCRLNIEHVKRYQSRQTVITGKLNGVMMPLWSNLIDEPFEINFIYYGTVWPFSIKGPYRHTKRSAYFYMLSGKMCLVHRSGEKENFCEHIIEPDAKIYMPIDEEYCLVCIGDKTAHFLNICDYAWREGDNEQQMADFSKYDFTKWGIKNEDDKNI